MFTVYGAIIKGSMKLGVCRKEENDYPQLQEFLRQKVPDFSSIEVLFEGAKDKELANRIKTSIQDAIDITRSLSSEGNDSNIEEKIGVNQGISTDPNLRKYCKLSFILSVLSRESARLDGDTESFDTYDSFTNQYKTQLIVLGVPKAELDMVEDAVQELDEIALAGELENKVNSALETGMNPVMPPPYMKKVEENSTVEEEPEVEPEAVEEEESTADEEEEDRSSPDSLEKSFSEVPDEEEVEKSLLETKFMRARCGYAFYKRSGDEAKTERFLSQAVKIKREMVSKKYATFQELTSLEAIISRLSIKQLKDRFKECEKSLKEGLTHDAEEKNTKRYKNIKFIESKIAELVDVIRAHRVRGGQNTELANMQSQLRDYKRKLQVLVDSDVNGRKN